MLQKRYLLGRVLGQGGFGITYLGLDSLLGNRIAIKEYYPTGYASRIATASPTVVFTSSGAHGVAEEGKRRFLREAKVLAKLDGTRGVVSVKNYFEENGTAYIVMEYLEGEDLQSYLQHTVLSADRVFELFAPIMDALEHVHAEHVIHRDISPQNIKVLADGSLCLMDFGAARVVELDNTRSVSVLLKPGYSPEEQYSRKGKIGPWTDIYALCATMYKCITGITPDDPLQRMTSPEDTVVWPSSLGIEIAPLQETMLKKGMAIRARDRFGSVTKMKAFLHGEKTPETANCRDFPLENEGGALTYMPDSNRKKKRTPLVIAAAIGLVLVGGGVAFALMDAPWQATAHAAPQVTAKDYEGTYDGKAHSATVELGENVSSGGAVDASIYYSEQPLTFENYQDALAGGAASSKPFERTNAGETKVYYLAVHDPDGDVAPTAEDCTSGSTSVRIYKAAQRIELEKKTYSKSTESENFKLGASAKGKLSYASSKTAVAKVSKSGTVDIVGAGTAKITVRAAASANYKAARTSVTVKVAQAMTPSTAEGATGNTAESTAEAPSYKSTSGDSENSENSGGSTGGGSSGNSSSDGKPSEESIESVEIDGWV